MFVVVREFHFLTPFPPSQGGQTNRRVHVQEVGLRLPRHPPRSPRTPPQTYPGAETVRHSARPRLGRNSQTRQRQLPQVRRQVPPGEERTRERAKRAIPLAPRRLHRYSWLSLALAERASHSPFAPRLHCYSWLSLALAERARHDPFAPRRSRTGDFYSSLSLARPPFLLCTAPNRLRTSDCCSSFVDATSLACRSLTSFSP